MHTKFKYHVPNINRQTASRLTDRGGRRHKSNRYLHEHIVKYLSKAVLCTHTNTQTSNVVNARYRFECAPSCPIAQNRSTNHDACCVLDTHRLFSLGLRSCFDSPVAASVIELKGESGRSCDTGR